METNHETNTGPGRIGDCDSSEGTDQIVEAERLLAAGFEIRKARLRSGTDLLKIARSYDTIARR